MLWWLYSLKGVKLKANNTKKDSTQTNNKFRIFLYILLFILLTASLIIGIMFATPSQDNYTTTAPKNDTDDTYVLDATISDTTSDDTTTSSVDETVDCKLTIEALSIDLPVLAYCTDEALKESLCKFSGNQVGEDGNYVIAGHSATDFAPFSSINKLNIGDHITLTDKNESTFKYVVYKMEYVDPDDLYALEIIEHTNEVTLLTCTDNNTLRLLVRCYLVSTNG